MADLLRRACRKGTKDAAALRERAACASLIVWDEAALCVVFPPSEACLWNVAGTHQECKAFDVCRFKPL